MHITFLIDNLPHPTLPLLTEHGLSMYIDQITPNSSLQTPHSILCDMGASGAFMKNAQALGIDLEACNFAFLSHGHADHTGGLGCFLAQHAHLSIYAARHIAHTQYFSNRPLKSRINASTHQQPNNSTTPNSSLLTPNSPRYIGPDLNLFCGHTPWFKPIEQNQWLTPTIAMVFPTCSNYPTPLGNKYLYTDELENQRIGDVLTTEGNNRLTPNSSLLTPNFLSSGTVRDDFSHEIALAFVTEKGLVVVSSCSHKGALNTIQSCMEFTGCNALHAYVGGLHFVDSEEVIKETTDFINEWLRLYPNAQLYTGHCTCPRAATLLKTHLPHCHTFYTGNVVEI